MQKVTVNSIKFLSILFLFICTFSCGGPSDKTMETDENSTANQSFGDDSASKVGDKNENYHELGSMKFTYQGESVEINSFEKNRTDLTFSQNSMVLRCAGEGDRRIQLGIMKPGVYKNPEGEYKSGKNDANPKFTFTYYPDYSAETLKTLTSTNGTLTVKKLDMETGEVQLSINTKVGDLQDIINKTGDDFTLTLDMDFEKIVLDPSLKQKLAKNE